MRELYRCDGLFSWATANWGRKIAEALKSSPRIHAPFLWLARLRARSLLSDLNRGRCGYGSARASGSSSIVRPTPRARQVASDELVAQARR